MKHGFKNNFTTFLLTAKTALRNDVRSNLQKDKFTNGCREKMLDS